MTTSPEEEVPDATPGAGVGDPDAAILVAGPASGTAEDAPGAGDSADAEVAYVPASDGETAVSIGDFFHRLYQITYSKVLGVVIILAMAVLVLIGVLVDQAPAWNDPAARADFLAQARTKYADLTGVLRVTGAFHMFSSVGFYVVVAALAISITGCTVHRLPQLWQRWRHPRTHVSARFFTAARYRASVPAIASPQAAIGVAAARLRRQHYRVIEDGDTALYADKFGWGPFGTAASHLSFLIIMAAFLVSGLTGTSVLLNVPIGGAGVPVADGSSLAVKVTSYNQTADAATGRPTDYVSHVVLEDGGTVVAEQDVRVNSPLVYGPWTFHQYSPEGFSLDVSATNATGTVLFRGTVPQEYTNTDGSLSVGIFRIDSLGLNVQVETPASGQTSVPLTSGSLLPGQVIFVVYPDGADQPTAMDAIAPVDPGASITYGDLTLTFERESHYTGILVRTDPGTWLMWVGGILLVAGMTVTFMCRHRRLWVRAEDGRLLLASADKEDPGNRSYFTELTNQAPTWFDGRNH
ncbi:MAG: cytochrome c biogenesis protein ResB [Actinomycetia bacterium]|nr:cytochrome c biogenesis protein ResB [Actinomycetes bacterium]